MGKSLQEAMDSVTEVNNQVEEIAKSIALQYSAELDEIIAYTSDHVNELNNDQLRALVTDLSFKAYSLGEAKEYTALKSDIANTLWKENQAIEFNTAVGTVDARRNAATINSENEALVNMIYSTTTSLLKTKLDECHRIVDTLKTVILSRNTESKINVALNDLREGM